ncbi:hypothetical protein BS78_07G105200 [Paspalum vaginatum]|nr:hypothetical protein BS78_07G105200 [Paspalum vaginatum]
MSIDDYYSAFDRPMGALTFMVPECISDPCPAHQFIEKFLIYTFVMGVRAEYDFSSTLTMSQALSDLLAEETYLKSMSMAPDSGSHSVLAASQRIDTHKASSSVPCKHCGKTNRISENCFSQHPEKLADFCVHRAARDHGTSSTSRGSMSVVSAVTAPSSSRPSP